MIARVRTVWMRFSKFARKIAGFDARQCNDGGVSYPHQGEQETRVDASDARSEGSEDDVVVEYHRADQAKIGEQLRKRYDEVAQQELPRDILELLSDLNQRLKRRDGD